MLISHTTLIDASPEAVWAATTDVERWPELTPTVTSVRRLDAGPFRRGSRALIKQPLMPEALWEVTALDTGRRFEWKAGVPGLRMTARHELTPSGEGTLNKLEVEMRGPVAALLGPILRVAVGRALGLENEGFRRASRGYTSAREEG